MPDVGPQPLGELMAEDEDAGAPVEGAVMKIVLRVAGPLFIAVGLFWFAQGTGLLPWPHNSATVDYGAGVAAIGIGLVWFGWQ